MLRFILSQFFLTGTLTLFFLEPQNGYAHQKKEASSIQSSTDEEAFLIRRIAEFWKDGDYSLVKTQILNFLSGTLTAQSMTIFMES